MIQIARVEDGNVVEIREIDRITSIGKHKRHLWFRIYDKIPKYDDFYEQLEGPVRNINEKDITLTYTVTPLPKEYFNDLLRGEKQKRLRQLITLDQQVELLLSMHKGEVIDDHFLAVLDKVQILMNKFYELSNMDKLPKDFEDNKYWE